jgi:hypothetical protein
LSTPPSTLVGYLGWHPSTAAGGRLGAALHKNSPDHFLARGMPGGDVEEFFCGLWLVKAELVYKGSIVCAGLEHRDDIGIADLGEFMTFLGDAPDVIPQGLLGRTYVSWMLPVKISLRSSQQSIEFLGKWSSQALDVSTKQMGRH